MKSRTNEKVNDKTNLSPSVTHMKNLLKSHKTVLVPVPNSVLYVTVKLFSV